MDACRAVYEKRFSIVQQLRKNWHGLNQTVMHFTFWIFAIGYGKPDPFDACVGGHIAIALCAFALFEQSNDMCTANFFQQREVCAARTMIECQPSIADFDEIDRG